MKSAIQLFQKALQVYKEFYTAHPITEVVYTDIVAANVGTVAVLETLSAVKVKQGLLEDGIAASAEALKIR